MITLPWHEALSWVITLVSFTLFIVERRRNDNTKEYMVLQLQEQIMGSMKSLQPDKDMPFDVGGFVRSAQAPRQ